MTTQRYTWGCSRRVQRLVRAVRAELTEELRSPRYRDQPIPSAGHCYVASEAIYHLLGGKAKGWKAMQIRHEGEPHWFLVNERTGCRVDATQDQFCEPVKPSRARGKGFLTKQPSKRAKVVMDRARARLRRRR